MSELFHNVETPGNNNYDHGTFSRLQALQAQGPDVMRRFASALWETLNLDDQLEYIHEAIAVIGEDEDTKINLDRHINMRLVTEYLLPKADTRQHYHRVNLRR